MTLHKHILLKKLEKWGEDFECKFTNPPFNGNQSEASFNIENIKQDSERINSLITNLKCVKLEHEYAFENGILLMVVKL